MRALYALFSRHGKVLEVIVLRRDGLRGQAFVIMQDIPAATAARQNVNGFTFFEKDLVVEYAKEKSDRIARMDGTYVPKAKRQKQSSLGQEQENAAPEDDTAAGEENTDPKDSTTPSDNDNNNVNTTVDVGDPSKYLFAENLPAECNEMMLGMLFRQYAGYKEVRMPRPGLAFIEFEEEAHATLALKGLNGFKLTQSDTLVLRYGKS